MRHQPDSTQDFESTRSEIAYLGRLLAETCERLAFQARTIDPTTPESLPRLYRGRVSAVCTDLLTDAVATITRLGVMSEEDAEREELAAVDVFIALNGDDDS